ncbi:MAG: SDR family oxidoreductase [Spirochaetia bacterium]|jgi:NAD(P)-dependent dehydrogenase (short-subunit alcohol dehydrogenase family)
MKNDRTIIVTGASSGVGEELSVRFASKGWAVCAISRNQDSLELLNRKYPDRISVFPCDVADPAQVGATMKAIAHKFGRIDVLVNNAAVFEMISFTLQDVARIGEIVDTNLKGVMYCSRFVLPYMIEKTSGIIVNIASVAGTHGIPLQAAYCASKHGVIGFADALAQEIVDKGIRVVTLCPGGIDTPLWRLGKTPYPGDISKTMRTSDVGSLVEYIIEQPEGILFKQVIFFPTNEWH